MKKLTKRLAVVFMICAMAFAMTACGEIDMNKIKGDWTIQTINGKTPEEVAAENGVDVYLVNKNYTLTDKTFTIKEASGQVECPIEVCSNGFNFTLAGSKGGCEYDEKAGTLKYGINSDVWILKKGTSDITAPAAPAEEGGEEGGAEEGGAEEGGEEYAEE